MSEDSLTLHSCGASIEVEYSDEELLQPEDHDFNPYNDEYAGDLRRGTKYCEILKYIELNVYPQKISEIH